MKEIKDRQEFLLQSSSHLDAMLDCVSHVKSIALEDLPSQSTLIVVVDLNQGFAKSGALYSPRTEALLPSASALIDRCIAHRYTILPYTDCHQPDCLEFSSYPPHCLAGTSESLMAPELSRLQVLARPKNSTNAFLADSEAFASDTLTHVVSLGCCTDICIYQLAVTLSAYYTQHNRKVSVMVPVELVDTYDAPGHPADFCNICALYSMQQNGVTLIKNIL